MVKGRVCSLCTKRTRRSATDVVYTGNANILVACTFALWYRSSEEYGECIRTMAAAMVTDTATVEPAVQQAKVAFTMDDSIHELSQGTRDANPPSPRFCWFFPLPGVDETPKGCGTTVWRVRSCQFHAVARDSISKRTLVDVSIVDVTNPWLSRYARGGRTPGVSVRQISTSD